MKTMKYMYNTGRMVELLRKEQRSFKIPSCSHKKTKFTLLCVEKEGIMVCIDSRIANAVYYEYLENHLEDLLPIKDIRGGKVLK